MSLPLDWLSPSKEEDLLLQRAEAALVVACMHRLGIAYRAPAPHHIDPAASRDGLYGLVDEGRANRLGYHAAILDGTAQDKRPQVPEETAAALTGTAFDSGGPKPAGGRIPKGGCLGEASRRLAKGASPVGDAFLYDLAVYAGHRAEQDNRVQARFRAWSTCMADKGFDYADPWQANDNPRWKTQRPTAVERKTAVADVQCKKSTKLVATWHTVMIEHQQQAIATHAHEIRRYESAKNTKLANARRVLATT